MNSERHNSFNLVHKGLRVFLYDTATQLQRADLSSEKSIEVIHHIELLLRLFESHAHNEDTYFNTPLEQVNPSVARLFEAEHQEDHRLSIVIDNLIHSWKKATNADKRKETGRLLFYAFNEFIAFNLYHMNKEEIQLNEALWKEYSDDSIRATEQALVQSIPPDKMAMYAQWMLKGNNDEDLRKWLTEVRDHAPAEVFGFMMDLASKELAPQRFDRLHSSLSKKMAVV